MARPLVIVESPAKAKTIAKFLGDAFDVRASVGHVADLPSKGLAVDVDNGFKPTYELTERGKQVVKDLRLALKDASELYLATDEDREGEAISWHLLEYLKPKVPVKRMVFHEITKAAIDHAVNNPRGHRLRARRRRRDPPHPRPPLRLRGVARAVAAGQPGPVGGAGPEPVDPAHRRTRARAHRVRVRRLLGHRARHRHVAAVHRHARRRRRRRGSPPGRTSTPAACCAMPPRQDRRPRRAAGASARRRPRRRAVHRAQRRGAAVPVVAQGAVHDVDAAAGGWAPAAAVGVAGDAPRTGAVRTRVHHLHAYRQRHAVERGRDRGARHDHQGVRPAVPVAAHRSSTRRRSRTPRRPTRRSARPRRSAVPTRSQGELNAQELALYRLVWQRTLASQMADATGTTVSVRLGAVSTFESTDCVFAASGTTITFPGHRAVYVEARADDDGDNGDDEALLPPLDERRSGTGRLADAERSRHHAAGPLHRGVARQAARGARHRATVDVGVDHPDRPGPRLRVEEGSGADPDLDRVRRRRA